MMARCDSILCLSTITIETCVSFNFLYISMIKSYQLSSMSKSKKKITSLIIFIPKEKRFITIF